MHLDLGWIAAMDRLSFCRLLHTQFYSIAHTTFYRTQCWIEQWNAFSQPIDDDDDITEICTRQQTHTHTHARTWEYMEKKMIYLITLHRAMCTHWLAIRQNEWIINIVWCFTAECKVFRSEIFHFTPPNIPLRVCNDLCAQMCVYARDGLCPFGSVSNNFFVNISSEIQWIQSDTRIVFASQLHKKNFFYHFSLLFAIGTKNCLCACVANADRDYSQSKQSEECCKMRIVFSLVFDSYVCVLTVRIRFVRIKSAPETSSKVIKILKFSKRTDDFLCLQMHRCHT